MCKNHVTHIVPVLGHLVARGTENKFYVKKMRRNMVKAIRITYDAMLVA